MGKFVLTAFLLVAGATMCLAAGDGFSYDDDATDGPPKWGDDCQKDSQTPIDIVPSDTKHENLGTFKLVNYGKTLPNVHFTAVNADGTTLKYSFPLYHYNVSGGSLPSTYTAVQFHFHWGNNSDEGSEHTVDGKYFPAELHIVHLNTKYSSLGDALKESDGLAVLGVFIKVGNENEKLKSLLEHAKNVTLPNDKVTEIPSIPLMDLLPTNLTAFYRYPGSLTTPPCSRAVVWTVFKEYIEMSDAQLNLMRSLKLDNTTIIGKNFRPIQTLGDRTVIFSSPGAPTPPGPTAKGYQLLYSTFSLLLSMLLAAIFLN